MITKRRDVTISTAIFQRLLISLLKEMICVSLKRNHIWRSRSLIWNLLMCVLLGAQTDHRTRGRFRVFRSALRFAVPFSSAVKLSRQSNKGNQSRLLRRSLIVRWILINWNLCVRRKSNARAITRSLRIYVYVYTYTDIHI